MIFRVVRREDHRGVGETLHFELPPILGAEVIEFVEAGTSTGEFWSALVETRAMLDRLKRDQAANLALHELGQLHRQELAAQCLRLQYADMEVVPLPAPSDAYTLEWQW